MRNSQSNHDDHVLESYRRYLLGEMDEAEKEDFEHQLLLEPDLDIEALDSDLIDACIRGEIPSEESQRLLARLTSPPAGHDRRPFLRDLTTLAHEAEPRPRNNISPFTPRSPKIDRPFHFLKTALAATLLLGIGIPVWRGMVQPPPPPTVFSLGLSTLRGTNQIPQLEVPSETERVEIQVDVAGEEYPSYNLVLTDVVSGKEVAKESGVSPQTTQEGDVLSLELQASDLRDGEYRLDVYGAEANGPPELLGAPEFEVLQTD